VLACRPKKIDERRRNCGCGRSRAVLQVRWSAVECSGVSRDVVIVCSAVRMVLRCRRDSKVVWCKKHEAAPPIEGLYPPLPSSTSVQQASMCAI